MTRQVLFIHSAGAQGPHQGSSDLVAYLQDALGPDYNVMFPGMPDPENPEYEPWKERVKAELASLDGNAILIGHSLGASVLLKCLSEERIEKPIDGLFLVAAPYWGKHMDEYVLQDDFASSLPPIRHVFLYHSLNDPVVPLEHLARYEKQLPQATARRLDGSQHEFVAGLPVLVRDLKGL